MTKLIVFLSLFSVMSASAQTSFPRPPQYIALAFDGCPALERWDDTRAFAHELKTEKNISLHFTYFLSSVFFSRQKIKRSTPARTIDRGSLMLVLVKE